MNGKTKNVDLHSRSKDYLSQNNKYEPKSKKDSQIKYSSLDSSSSPRNKSFVANQHQGTITSNIIPGVAASTTLGTVSNIESNERILIDPSSSPSSPSSSSVRKGRDIMENNKREKNAQSIIYKASFHSDPVEYDHHHNFDPNTNPNKDSFDSRDHHDDTRSSHYNPSSNPFVSSSAHPSTSTPGEINLPQPQARVRRKAIQKEVMLKREKEEAMKCNYNQNLNENISNSQDLNLMTRGQDVEVVNEEEENSMDELDDELEEDKYELHKSTFTVSVVNRIDRSLCNDDPSSSVGRRKRVGKSEERKEEEGGNESLKCECNKIVIDVPSGNMYETIQGQDQEHIYEEVGLMKSGIGEEGEEMYPEGKKSIFDGASKDEILEYLEDAKGRVEVLISSNCEDTVGRNVIPSSSHLHREVMMSPEMRVSDEEEHHGKKQEEKREVDDGVIDAVTGGGSRKKRGSFPTSAASSSDLVLQHRGIAVSAENLIESTITSSSRRNRTSNVSNSSTDSAVTTSSSLEDESSSLRSTSGPSLITSSVSLTQLTHVERNDSGVGTETSKPTRLRRSSSAIVGESEQRCTDCEQVFDPVQLDETVTGFTSFFPLTCSKCDKKRSERREIISEFVETEFKYGRDLRIIREEFYRPVEVAGLLTKEQIKSVFLNLDELINVNSRFSEKLQDALDIATEQGDEVSDILTSYCLLLLPLTVFLFFFFFLFFFSQAFFHVSLEM